MANEDQEKILIKALMDKNAALHKSNAQLMETYASLISDYDELQAAYEALKAQGVPTSSKAEQIMASFRTEISDIRRQCT